MKKSNLDSSVQTLQDGTAGQLSDHLGELIAGVVKLARTVDADAAGEIDSVAIDRRGAGIAPKVNQWHMRLAVSKVGDQLPITGLELLR
ncbi:Uncharacterised protein [Mycobacteroides abscessus subsp. abscessus]|nr:Uncharacterised protein [Mycobacteroides abscessus subsp. abscessus]